MGYIGTYGGHKYQNERKGMYANEIVASAFADLKFDRSAHRWMYPKDASLWRATLKYDNPIVEIQDSLSLEFAEYALERLLMPFIGTCDVLEAEQCYLPMKTSSGVFFKNAGSNLKSDAIRDFPIAVDSLWDECLIYDLRPVWGVSGKIEMLPAKKFDRFLDNHNNPIDDLRTFIIPDIALHCMTLRLFPVST